MKRFLRYYILLIAVIYSSEIKSQCLVSASNTSPSTCGLSNGIVVMTFTGGLPPYAVNFNGVPMGTVTSVLSINGLAPGNYFFSVTDMNNVICTGDVNVTVNSIASNPPQVTISSVPPSCDSCADGIIMAMATGTAPFTYFWNTGSTAPNISGVSCGLYSLIVTDVNGCSSSDTVVLNCPSSGSHYLQGKVYYDTNNDSVYNAGDYPLSNQQLQLLPSGTMVYSNWNGDYSFLVDTGNYQITFIPQSSSPFQQAIGQDTIAVNVTNQSILNLNFALLPDSSSSDYIAMSNFWLPRCNSVQSLLTTVTNNGTTVDSLHVKIIFPPSMVYQNSNSLATVNVDTLTYFVGGLMPGQTIYLNSSFMLPAGGSQLLIKSFVTSVNNGVTYDTTSITSLVICGCDPNDKQVSPQLALVSIDKQLNYLIRFQNTGSDTTFKVVIIDTLSSLIDPSSFQLVASSHPCLVYRDNNILRFVFDNILLPDSTTNEAESHGYVFFNVKVLDNSWSMRILNKGHIFFDANADVETPYATTTFVVCVGVDEINSNKQLSVYPNPTRDVINLNFQRINNHRYSYSLINSQGQFVVVNANLELDKIIFPAYLPKGFYLLEIVDQTNQNKFTSKIQIK